MNEEYTDAPAERDENAASPSSGASRHLPPLGEGQEGLPPAGETVERSETDEGEGRAFAPSSVSSADIFPPEGGRTESGSKAERASSDEGERSPAAPDFRSHLASLWEQGAALRREIPGFDLGEALRDDDFLRLTSPAVGVSVRRAWYALHGAEREEQAARRARESAAESLARSAARPREGGRGLAGGDLGSLDPRALGRAGRSALRQRIYDAAARGEKLYP